MKTVKIFLASSFELKNDRKEFEAFLYQKTKLWQKERNIFFELVNWEDFIDAMASTGLQDKYNEALEGCDIFVMLFSTKVGMYTNKEFETALKHFKEHGKPLIYTYHKDKENDQPVTESVASFQKKLQELGHFETTYKNTEGLLLHFNAQLDKLYGLTEIVPKANELMAEVSKEAILDMIDSNDFFEAFEVLNKVFKGKNIQLNNLIFEFVSPPNSFNPVRFTAQLKVFVNTKL